jgi:hypothetical protein
VAVFVYVYVYECMHTCMHYVCVFVCVRVTLPRRAGGGGADSGASVAAFMAQTQRTMANPAASSRSVIRRSSGRWPWFTSRSYLGPMRGPYEAQRPFRPAGAVCSG